MYNREWINLSLKTAGGYMVHITDLPSAYIETTLATLDCLELDKDKLAIYGRLKYEQLLRNDRKEVSPTGSDLASVVEEAAPENKSMTVASERLWKTARMVKLSLAISKTMDAEELVPLAWLDEFNRLTAELKSGSEAGHIF